MNKFGKAESSSWVPDVRRGWWILGAFVIQLATIPVISDPSALTLKKVVLALTAAMLVWGILPNLKLWSFRVLALGFALNALVIFLNGGLMPVSPENYARVAGPEAQRLVIGQTPPRTKAVLVEASDTRLKLLSDVIYVGQPTPRLFSIGDILLVVGLLVFAIEIGRRAAQHRRRFRLNYLATEGNNIG